MSQRIVSCVLILAILSSSSAGTVLVSSDTRNGYIVNAKSMLPDQESLIPTRDMTNGPPNKYNLKTHQTLDCNFVEPSAADPIGGTTPKFRCSFLHEGKQVVVKVKYDQQYNSVHKWGRGNEEVYASVISQRLLWATGFGTDHSVPVSVNCRNCPIEPWTYVQAVQGYDQEDIMSGWLDVELLKTDRWNKTAPLVKLDSAVVYFKFDEYYDGDEIQYISSANSSAPPEEGFGWHEMFNNASPNADEMVSRDALSVMAAFISHCDNFDGNQGFICLSDSSLSGNARVSSTSLVGKTVDHCDGTPFLYVHDVGGTLGFGWNLMHKNFWPNYMDLKQWKELSVWGDLSKCEVTVNGLPGCSWTHSLPVSEAGRALAARLLSKITTDQITQLFTTARANLMRGDAIEDWISGYYEKLNRDVLGTSCAAK